MLFCNFLFLSFSNLWNPIGLSLAPISSLYSFSLVIRHSRKLLQSKMKILEKPRKFFLKLTSKSKNRET